MMNRYSPAASTWEVSATMALDNKGSWIHIAEYEKLQAEIEQLRLRLKPSIDYTDGIPTGYGEDEIDRQQAEIERLREKANIDDNLLYAETEKVYLAEKEIERLRSGVRCPHCDELRLELGEARNEIKQLRELLREGMTMPIRSRVVPHSQNWEKRVNKALGDE